MNKKHLRQILKELPDWYVDSYRKGHVMLRHRENGQTLLVSGSPSCWRAMKNTKAKAKRLAEVPVPCRRLAAEFNAKLGIDFMSSM